MAEVQLGAFYVWIARQNRTFVVGIAWSPFRFLRAFKYCVVRALIPIQPAFWRVCRISRFSSFQPRPADRVSAAVRWPRAELGSRPCKRQLCETQVRVGPHPGHLLFAASSMLLSKCCLASFLAKSMCRARNLQFRRRNAKLGFSLLVAISRKTWPSMKWASAIFGVLPHV